MKTLIAYFSWSNNTKTLVERINAGLNYDVVRIERATPYSSDYDTCAYVEAKAEVTSKTHPEIKKLDIDYSKYDRILLFFPIWWYTFPMPIATFFEGLKGYRGKVYVFANSYTHDPQYMANSLRDLRSIDDQIDIHEGLFNKSVEEHLSFIESEER